MNLDYTVHIWREGLQYVAHAMPLDVISSGPSADEARAALDEAVRLFLATARELGTLEEVLEECSYQFGGDGWQAPEWIAVERHTTSLVA